MHTSDGGEIGDFSKRSARAIYFDAPGKSRWGSRGQGVEITEAFFQRLQTQRHGEPGHSRKLFKGLARVVLETLEIYGHRAPERWRRDWISKCEQRPSDRG